MVDEAQGYVVQQGAPDGPLTGRNLDDFVLCPRKYLLSFFASHGDSRERIGGPAALHQAVRASLIELYRIGIASATAASAEAAFDAHWDGHACSDSREEDELHRDGLLLLARHIAAPLPLSSQVVADVRLEASLDGHRFVAVADLLADDPPVAARFVTARRPPSVAEAAQGFSWLLLYLLAMEHFGGADVGCLMVNLREDRTLPFDPDREDLANARTRLAQAAERVRQEGEFSPKTGGHCRWCRSRRACPAWRR